jgi:hypothetical protein
MPDVQFANAASFERAWAAWVWLERIDWRSLPASGGLLDQPAELMNDILKIVRVARWARKSFQKDR